MAYIPYLSNLNPTSMREFIINTVPFARLLGSFLSFFGVEYGQKLVEELGTKVYTSKKANKFLLETRQRRIKPGTDDYLRVIHSSSHFTFSKAENICFASIMLLHKWNIEVGVPAGISSDHYLNTVFFSMIDKCNRYKRRSADLHFLERFMEVLENLVANEPAHEIPSTGFPSPLPNEIPEGLFNDLYGMNINEALEQRIINDVGDDNGVFVHCLLQDEETVYFAVVQGYHIHITPDAAKTVNEEDGLAGGLVFGYDAYHRPSLL